MSLGRCSRPPPIPSLVTTALLLAVLRFQPRPAARVRSARLDRPASGPSVASPLLAKKCSSFPRTVSMLRPPLESSAGPVPVSRCWQELEQSPPPEIAVLQEHPTVLLHKFLDLGPERVIYIHLEDEFKSH